MFSPFHRKKCIFFIFIPLLLVIVGCARQENTLVDVSVFQQSLEYGTQWAIISEPYATFRGDTDFSAPVSGYGRRGDVQKIIGYAIALSGAVRTVWYGFEKGWLPESSVVIYSNELKAKRASESLRE
jgi:hypothetical protein